MHPVAETPASPPSPRLVSSITETLAERRRAADADGKPEFAAKLLRAMQLVKRARFNAHERLEAKHTASVAAFTLATVAEIAISLFTIVYENKLPGDVRSFLDFASVVTGVFLFGFGLVVGLANFQTRALYLQRCAMDISSLAHEMEIAMPLTTAELQEFRRRYHEIEARCPTNHEPVDLQRALARTGDERALMRALWSQRIDIYGPYALATAGYLSLWLTFWSLLRV
jgi:hypothetical protein